MNSFIKCIKSFKYAFKGMVLLIKSENNFRIDIFCALIAVISGFILKLSLTEWGLLVLCIGMVLTAEAFNTVVEKLVNKIMPDQSDWAGSIKDISAAAVLLSAIAALITGLLIFIPKILSLV